MSKSAKKTTKPTAPKTDAVKPETKSAKAAEKEAVEDVRQYTLAGPISDKVRSHQILAVVEALTKLKTATMSQVAEFIAPKIKTVQTPERIATYYLSELRHKGVVKEVQ